MSKGNSGSLTVVIFALLIGLGGAFVVRQQMSRQNELPPLPLAKPAEKMIYVPTAALDFTKGHVLSLSDIQIFTYTQQQIDKSPYAGKAFMGDPNQLVGRALKIPLKKGEVFLPDQLYADGLGMGVAERLQPGYRAVTVPIQDVGAVYGFARPGTMVDVLFRSNSESDRPEQTLTLLERIQVLALNTDLRTDSIISSKDIGTVTLAVTPPQAKVLKVVEGRGDLSLALRNPNDTFQYSPIDLTDFNPLIGQVSYRDRALARHATDSRSAAEADTLDQMLEDGSERVTLNDLLGIPRPKPKKEMEVYRAGTKEVLAFEIANDSDLQLLDRGGRIRVPIAHDLPTPTPGGLGSIQNRPVRFDAIP